VRLSIRISTSDPPAGSAAATPKPVWNVEVPPAMNFDAQWQEAPDIDPFKNSYRWGWEQFFRHVADGEPLRSTPSRSRGSSRFA
jgi:hypothetical protein